MASWTSYIGGRTAQASIQPAEQLSGAQYAGQGWPTSTSNTPAILYFQFFPETISDERVPNWSSMAIPGGSHPLYQWVQGGERTIQFDAAFGMDTAVLSSFGLGIGTAMSAASGPSGGETKYTRDIAATVAALRWFTYPHYDYTTGKVSAPSRIKLILEGTSIGVSLGDVILCVMQNCSVQYTAFFPDGTPKLARVSLSFAEIVQEPGAGIEWQDRNLFRQHDLKYGLANGNVRPEMMGDLQSGEGYGIT